MNMIILGNIMVHTTIGEMEEWASSDYNAVYSESEDFVDSEDEGSDEVDYWFFNA